LKSSGETLTSGMMMQRHRRPFAVLRSPRGNKTHRDIFIREWYTCRQDMTADAETRRRVIQWTQATKFPCDITWIERR
jgi:hypothetical protein